jgi:hypothetical protein
MTIEIDGNKVTVFDKNCKELDLGGITAIEIRAIAGEPTEAIFTARPCHVTVKDVIRASIQELDKGDKSE